MPLKTINKEGKNDVVDIWNVINYCTWQCSRHVRNIRLQYCIESMSNRRLTPVLVNSQCKHKANANLCRPSTLSAPGSFICIKYGGITADSTVTLVNSGIDAIMSMANWANESSVIARHPRPLPQATASSSNIDDAIAVIDLAIDKASLLDVTFLMSTINGAIILSLINTSTAGLL